MKPSGEHRHAADSGPSRGRPAARRARRRRARSPGPSPSSPLTPSTATSVSEATAADSCSVAGVRGQRRRQQRGVAADRQLVRASSRMRQANRVTDHPAAGLRAIDPAPVPAAARARSTPPPGPPDGPGRARPPAAAVRARAATSRSPPRLARGLRGGFRWDAEDSRTKDWYPQGIDGRGGRRARLLVPQARRRRAALDRRHRHRPLRPRRARDCPTASRSRPTRAGSPGARTGCTSPTPTSGLRLFDLRRFSGRTLPQAGWYRPESKDLRFSYASVDDAAGALLVGEYRDKAAGARLVRWKFAPGGLLAQEAASEAWVTAHPNLQGAAVHDGRMLMAAQPRVAARGHAHAVAVRGERGEAAVADRLRGPGDRRRRGRLAHRAPRHARGRCARRRTVFRTAASSARRE